MSFAHFGVKTRERSQFIEITGEIDRIVKKSGINKGICLVSVPHTTAGVTINENADPSVMRDIEVKLNKIVPYDDEYTHTEGNSAAHIKSTLVGSSVGLIVAGGRLSLGTWQGIYFCEFDGPRKRSVRVQIVVGGDP